MTIASMRRPWTECKGPFLYAREARDALLGGFGNVADGRPFWISDFSADGKKDVLFYYPGDRNWWLGRFRGDEGHLDQPLEAETDLPLRDLLATKLRELR
jgi:hypothetical protein